MLASEPTARRIGQVLVTAQLALIAALAWAAVPLFLRGVAPAWTWLAAAAGLALGLWALACNRPGNFNIHPVPRIGGQLVVHGPYRWIRHPMYSAVLACALAAAGAIAAGASLLAWLAVAALAAVLAAKARLEEGWMLQAHPDYAAYRARSWRFLPGLY